MPTEQTMSDFDKILWGFAFSATGIVIGWILNQAGQWFRTRQEDKKNLKQVIFNLFETYHWLLRCNFDAITKIITDKVLAIMPKEQQIAETYAELNRFSSEIVMNYFKPEILNQLSNIQEGYQSSIKSLASIDPLAAFYLSGKTSVLDKLEMIEKWRENLQNENSLNSNKIVREGKIEMGIIKSDILENELKNLEDNILILSFKVNPAMWWRTRIEIKRMKHSITTNLEKKIEELIKKHYHG